MFAEPVVAPVSPIFWDGDSERGSYRDRCTSRDTALVRIPRIIKHKAHCENQLGRHNRTASLDDDDDDDDDDDG